MLFKVKICDDEFLINFEQPNIKKTELFSNVQNYIMIRIMF